MVGLKPDAAAVDSLQTFPFLKSPTLANLKAKLPSYLVKAADTDLSTDILLWWKTNSTDLPHWSAAAADALLVQPSSAAAVCVFSLLKASFGPQQDTTLNDYIQA